MNIERHVYTISHIVNGYKDNEESGVIAFDGKLNVRPAYQREFVYKDKQRDAVIDTITKNFPLNVMYWAKNDDGTFEVLDGQQRTISFCQYVNGEFSFNGKFFHNLTYEEQKMILYYPLDIYICEGTEREKLEWFKTINIAGEVLTDQELLNATYTGRWLSYAKGKFSKTNCVAYKIANKYVKGTPIRQDYLETALRWVTNDEKDGIVNYMAKHQHDSDALELWDYFRSVIEWVSTKFPYYRKEMKGIEWGLLYNKYKGNNYDADAMEVEIKRLMADDDVTSKKGIYEYILSGGELEKKLNIRQFTDTQKRTAYERQQGICPLCNTWHPFEEMEGDHITPWSKGGKTSLDNLQMICKPCNRTKSNK